MSNFYTRALSSFGASHGLHIHGNMVEDAPDSVVKDPVSNKQHSTQTVSAPVKLQSDATVVVNPRTSVPSTLLDGGSVEFSIPKDQLSKLDNAYLKLSITNDTGSDVKLSPAKALLEKVEIYKDAGGVCLIQLDYLQLWFENMFMTSDQWAAYATIGNSNTSYTTAGATISDSASVTYYIPIFSILDSSNMCLGGLNSDLMIRFKFQSATYTVQDGDLPDVNSAALLLRGVYEPAHITAKRKQQYLMGSVLLKFLDAQLNTHHTALAASSSYSINLPSIKGPVAYLWIGVRASARSATNQLTFTQTGNISTIDIQTSDGQSMLGFYQRDPVECKRLVYPELVHDNQFNLNTDAIFIPFCSNPRLSYMTGANTGFNTFTGFEKLVFTTNASFSGGNYEIVVLARVYNHLVIEKGDIKKITI